MDFLFTVEEEAFRRELRAGLETNLPRISTRLPETCSPGLSEHILDMTS